MVVFQVYQNKTASDKQFQKHACVLNNVLSNAIEHMRLLFDLLRSMQASKMALRRHVHDESLNKQEIIHAKITKL